MNIYTKYQPVTWYVGVIETSPKKVARVIQPLYIPNDELDGIYQKKVSIDKGLELLEPLGPPHSKFLLVETIDGRTAIFTNTFFDTVQMPTSYAAEKLSASAYYVCNVPNTISKDQRTGAWGGRKLEYRIPGNTIVQEPTFGIHLINDCGRWCFYRYGDKLPFEDEKTYKSYRKRNRFTEEMLVDYCQALGIPVYDSKFYSNKCIIIERHPRPDEKGISYEEAAIQLRIGQNK